MLSPDRPLPSLFFPILFGFVALSPPALAQDIATARALFNRGLVDMQAKNYEAGCTAIAESQRIDPRPGTLFTLAVCEMRWGRIATAAARYTDYLSVYERLPPDQKARQAGRAKEAAQQLAALNQEVPQLLLELPEGAPVDTVVRRDGVVLAPAALGIELPVDPGEHVITTQAPLGPVEEHRITLLKGQKKKLSLRVTPKAKEEPPASTPAPPVKEKPKPPPSTEGVSGQRLVAYGLFGVGGAGFVAGGVTGALTLKRKAIVDQNCGASINMPEAKCNHAGYSAANTGKTLALASTISFGVGVAAIGAAVVMVLIERKPATLPAAAERRWMTAGVLEAGPNGALVGVRGSF